ncbi:MULTISPECIES: 3-dehydroquinate synthase [Fusobacterium]|uniref:3-dehydroquinate synthase n=1 Tax=Fusobacterium TaxID=848 RepID=UPI0008A1003A|nr:MULTISPECIES: 3-dehydroquinate synthase [Fusobacterium]OFL83477.1 3-dehydroquinate synthase [Fusobacterium sp. HMSC073F01]
MKLRIELREKSYDIHIEKGILHKIKEYINLDRKVMIVTDKGVPEKYMNIVKAQCPNGYSIAVEQGEGAKSFKVFEEVCRKLLDLGFHRNDLIIALGGGVIGDLAGFAAASYMRGIDFINIPTTTLSQIDSSIGGKTAINLGDTKNIIGAFYQPKGVFIDLEVLKTLPERHYYNGLVEALKAGLIYDRELFEIFENKNIDENLQEIIYRALLVKKDVVEKDEKEENLRKILNFGHTVGHGIEGFFHLKDVLHGEGVAMGMLPMIEDEELRERTKKILKKMNIDTDIKYDREKVFELMLKDKKSDQDKITLVKVKELGKAELVKVPIEKCKNYLK